MTRRRDIHAYLLSLNGACMVFRDLIDDFDGFSGQPDTFLDVPFVPSDEEVVEAMLELAGVGPNDVLYDLGAGDGRIVVAAAKERDARSVGIELDPLRVADAMEYAGWSRVEYLVDFIEESIFTADISEATVVTLYLLQSVNVQLRPKLLRELRPGARIVSHAFDMGDWKPDDRIKLDGTNIYKWIVPASVKGPWEWDGADGKSYRIELQQQYQEVTGSAWVADEPVQLKSAMLRGTELTLELWDDKTSSLERITLDFTDAENPSVDFHV